MDWIKVIIRLFWVSRPILWLNTIGPAFIGLWLTGHLWDPKMLPILIWLGLPFNLLIYGTNDISDREVDAISERKGLFEGTVLANREVGIVASAVFLTNVPFFIYFSYWLPSSALWAMLAYIAVFMGYSITPFRFKARPILDSVSNAAYAFPLWFVPLALESTPNYLALCSLMTWSMAKHTFDSIQDIEEDRICDLRTTAVTFGLKFALGWSAFWWMVATTLLIFINPYIAGVVFIGSALLVGALYKTPTPKKAHDLYRYSIGYPYIAGTIAGVSLALTVWQGQLL